MGFFSSDKKEKVQSKVIRPTVVRTQNVPKELLNISKSYEVSVNKLDFNLLEVQTYTRMYDGVKETDWEEITVSELHELDDETAILNPQFQIRQMYEIEIFSKNSEDNKYRNFHLAVGANATKCKVYLSIKEGSEISYSSRLEKELLILINNRKIRAGMLINIFDNMLGSAISKLSANIRIQEHVVYEKNETILIAQSYEPTLTTNDSIIFHYDKKVDVNDNDKVDYASRGFIQNVFENELLIEYIKPKLGKAGRNCRGEFMKALEPIVKNEPKFTVDDTIKVTENEEKIIYTAKESGYIALDGNVYTIKNEVDVGEITFKTTGSISSGLESDVSISVKESDAIKDAVGTGMNVEVSEIHIDGNVGPNTKINALKAVVDGQTHKTAQLRAEKLKINVHKGEAWGDSISITRLEHGKAYGQNVDISQAIGGIVEGREVIVELCGSHVKIKASKLIEIKKLHGSENTFSIDPLLKKDTNDGVERNKDEIEKYTQGVKDLKKELIKYKELVKGNTVAFLDVKKRLIHYKKNGVKMPESFVKKYKQFKKMQDHLIKVEKKYAIDSDHLNLLTKRTASFQDNIFDARIINRGEWIGYNELKFRLIDPPIELSYKPIAGSKDKIFAIVEIEDEDGNIDYEIKAVKE